MTNDLYREIQEAQARYVREDCFNNVPVKHPTSGSHRKAKSLFQNILPLSPCGSIFYPNRARYTCGKLLRMSILPAAKKKNGTAIAPVRISAMERQSLGEIPTGRFESAPAISTKVRTPCAGDEPVPFPHRRNLYWQSQRSTIYPCPSKLKSRLLRPFARLAATPSPAKAGSRKPPCAC